VVIRRGAIDTLSVDGWEIAVESIKKGIRDAFLQSRSKEPAAKLTDQVSSGRIFAKSRTSRGE
jgi:hypothetical protein